MMTRLVNLQKMYYFNNQLIVQVIYLLKTAGFSF